MSRFVLLIGPPGAGKSTIIRLAKQRGLKTGGRVQSIAEAGERHGCHGFENVGLLDQGFQHRADAFEGMNGREKLVAREIPFDLVQFVEQELEP